MSGFNEESIVWLIAHASWLNTREEMVDAIIENFSSDISDAERMALSAIAFRRFLAVTARG